jgi:hypothetical protein
LLRPLFRRPAVVAVTVSLVAVDYWLFASHGLGAALQQILRSPIGLLAVLGLSVLSGAFHECGDAAGCRYSGARPGVIGVGIYLVWPSFFTNVTDAYRLSRAGRLRTDLGGVYFNAVFILALAGLRRGTRILVTCWMLVVIPLLIGVMSHLLLRLPEINRALWNSVSLQARLMAAAAAGHHYAMAAVDAVGAALVTLSLVGTLYIAIGLARRAVTLGRRWSAGRPARGLLAAAAGLACATTLATLWTVQGGFHGW